MEPRIKRALQNRWVAATATITIGYVGLWVMVRVIEEAYYDYYLYPRIKGAEYSYPELRYSFGQAAILLWSLAGLCTAALTARRVFVSTETKWAARSAIAIALGFVLLIVGSVAGMAMRDVGF